MNIVKKGLFFFAESFNGKFLNSSFELISYCRKINSENQKKITAVAIGEKFTDEELQKLLHYGTDNIIIAQHENLTNFNGECYSEVLTAMCRKYKPDIFLASATPDGRTLFPYTAMQLNCGLTADCTDLKIEETSGDLLQTRPAIGGNIMATIKTSGNKPQMATVRPNSIEKPDLDKKRKGYTVNFDTESLKLISGITLKDFFPDEEKSCVTKSQIVVAVGRGIKKPDNLPLIYKFAEKINAAVGATREVVDRGWMDYSHQIGLSGKTITPKLYIGIGISGAIQHLAGMQTAKNIIAVNSDPNANIFNIANVGIIGDLFEVLPTLTKEINRKNEL